MNIQNLIVMCTFCLCKHENLYITHSNNHREQLSHAQSVNAGSGRAKYILTRETSD